ncbi:MAG: diacylglycerol/polyprenol kinase family protein [Candidatus Helarchaeota archaeon]
MENAVLGIILVITAIVLLKLALKFDNREAFYSSLISSAVVIIVGAYFFVRGLLVVFGSPYDPFAAINLPLAPPFPNAVLLFIPLLICFFGAYALKENHEGKYVSIELQKEIIHKSAINPLDLEIARKLFHTVIDGVLICYLFIGDFVSISTFTAATQMGTTFGYTPFFFIVSSIIWMKPPYVIPNAGQMVTIFPIIIIFFLIAFSDLIRIHKFRYYPIKMVSNIYRKKERSYLGPHVYLTSGALFAVVFFPPKIAMVTIAIAALGDAFATIIGVSVGKHKVRGGRKTWEGCLGGTLAGFGIGLLCYIILLTKYPNGSILQGIIISAVGSIVLFLIDFYSPPIKVSDNILNPVLCSISMFVVSLFF